jgi:DNA-binding NarL/FixJ family response regulator
VVRPVSIRCVVMTVTCRILIADDSLLIRTGVQGLVDGEPGVELVGAVGSLPELLEAVQRHQPDLVLSDVRMPPTYTDEGIRAAEELRRTAPGMAVIVLSQVADPTYLSRLIDGGSAKRGYLLKDRLAAPGELLTAIQVVHHGGSFIDPSVVELLVQAQSARRGSLMDTLSAREREILAGIATGRSNQAIGEALFISHRAVEKHINSIFVKLGLAEDPEINRRVQAVLLFLNGP